MPQAPVQTMPEPLPPTQFPMSEPEVEESPLFESQQPIAPPIPSPVEGWQLIESPDMYMEPDLYFEESPVFSMEQSAPCPPEKGYVPQVVSPEMQHNYPMPMMPMPMPMMPMPMPMMPMPMKQHGCGCGGSGNQPMMVPHYHDNPCNCNSHTHSQPFQMMPSPYQNNNWYGSY